jgi:catechol 2,3-dioxygenase-like lactoylglutathione lyase family enzyme
MLPIQGLHHLSFTVPDLGEARRFWCDLLGFSDIERPDFGFPGAWLRCFGTEVHLLQLPGRAEEADGALSPGRNHVAFRVDDLEAVRARLEGAGLEVLAGVAGIRQMFVLGPGASVIEFIQP